MFLGPNSNDFPVFHHGKLSHWTPSISRTAWRYNSEIHQTSTVPPFAVDPIHIPISTCNQTTQWRRHEIYRNSTIQPISQILVGQFERSPRLQSDQQFGAITPVWGFTTRLGMGYAWLSLSPTNPNDADLISTLN
jgi:hypothetical protein